MRSEHLDEPVSVRADFHGGTVTPVAFRRRGREHRVRQVNTRWIDRAGKHPRFYFSVTDGWSNHWNGLSIVRVSTWLL